MAVEICSDIKTTGYIFTGSQNNMGVVKTSTRKSKRESPTTDCSITGERESGIEESHENPAEQNDIVSNLSEVQALGSQVSPEAINEDESKTTKGMDIDEFEGMTVLLTARHKELIFPVWKKKANKKSKTREKKEKKWKSVGIEDVGFYPSLFPRPQMITPEESEAEMELPPWQEETICYNCESEFDEIERKLCNKTDLEIYEKEEVKQTRSDRDRKVRKAAKQVKDKYCASIANNKGRKRLYIHHRVYKRMNLEPQTLHYFPNPNKLIKKRKDLKGEIAARKINKVNADKDKAVPPTAANTRHALHSQNAPLVLASDDAYINLLISLQHRDVTPEDYDLLLRLDEQVAPKTISQSTLDGFKTDLVGQNECHIQCAICMENYIIGQKRKFLPCDHDFHSNCIDMWLQNSSMNCPLDGLPVQQ